MGLDEIRKIWNPDAIYDRFTKLFHRHRYDIPGAEEIKVGLIGGRHTAFMLLKCKCGNKIVFPQDNLKIAQSWGTEETLKLLASFGFESERG